MEGSILQLAKRDAKFFLTQGGFEISINILNPVTSVNVSLTGYATKHWLSFDTDGSAVNSKNAHICLSEIDLVARGYTVRNTKGEISLLKHIVTFKDSSGLDKKYVVRENYPDETLGLIVCILNDYKD